MTASSRHPELFADLGCRDFLSDADAEHLSLLKFNLLQCKDLRTAGLVDVHLVAFSRRSALSFARMERLFTGETRVDMCSSDWFRVDPSWVVRPNVLVRLAVHGDIGAFRDLLLQKGFFLHEAPYYAFRVGRLTAWWLRRRNNKWLAKLAWMN